MATDPRAAHRQDPMGQAISDYFATGRAARLRVFSPMFDEDEFPVATLFRTFDQMPATERKALDLAKGRTLDVGAGAGCHSLVMQQRGIDVTAIDLSPLSVATMRKRGVKKVLEQDFFTLGRLPAFFAQLDRILAPGGQVLCDSSDISYVYENDEGQIEYPDDMAYYGEVRYRMRYRDVIGQPFAWLYIDADTLRRQAEICGYTVEVIAEGAHYDYLARITKQQHT